MMRKLRITICNNKMAFTLIDNDARRQLRCIHTGGVNNDTGRDRGSIVKRDAIFADRKDAVAEPRDASFAYGFFHQTARCGQLINNTVASYQKSAGKPHAKVWLGRAQRLFVKDLSLDASLAVKRMFAADLVHLVFISRDPDRAAVFVLSVGRHFLSKFIPQLLRISRQRKLGLAIVHDNNVAHPGRGCAGRDAVWVDDDGAQTFFCESRGARRTDYTRTDDRDVIRHAAAMPKQNGSAS